LRFAILNLQFRRLLAAELSSGALPRCDGATARRARRRYAPLDPPAGPNPVASVPSPTLPYALWTMSGELKIED
jgi:hypothetical protein